MLRVFCWLPWIKHTLCRARQRTTRQRVVPTSNSVATGREQRQRPSQGEFCGVADLPGLLPSFVDDAMQSSKCRCDLR
eukprot:6291031-Amphidinium_carterae.1